MGDPDACHDGLRYGFLRLDRSVYSDAQAFGNFSELSYDTTGFADKIRKKEPLPTQPYLWRRCDCKDTPVPIYDGSSVGNTRLELSGGISGSMPYLLADAVILGHAHLTTNGLALLPDTPIEGFSAWKAEIGNKILARVRNQEIDLGVALGEHRETAEFVSQAMIKTAKSFRLFRRGRVSEALRVLTGRSNSKWRDIPGAAANAWLAYCYGLRPLVNDVYSAVSLLEKRHEPKPSVYSVHASLSKSINTLIGNDHYKIYARFVGTANLRAGIRMNVTNPVLRTLDQCGVVNPLSVAWELVPFSFVVDWFIPIGDFVANIVPPQGVDFVDGWISCHVNGGVQYTIARPPAGGSDVLGYSAQAFTREALKIREKLGALPRYTLKVPDMSLSRGQISSGIALLTQALIR